MKKGNCILLRFHFFLLFLLLSFVGFAQKTNINNGFLDLKSYSWQKDGIVTLRGNWEFYWKQFHSPAFLKDSTDKISKTFVYVPSFWNGYNGNNNTGDDGFGFATYRLVVNCPDGTESLALKLLTIEAAYKLFVNGKLILQVGNPGKTAEQTVSELKPQIVDVTPENSQLDIVIQVANFHNHVGGLWDEVKLGTREQIDSKFISNISLQFFVAGCFFLAAIYYLMLFAFFKRTYTLLFFSIVCLIIFTRSIVTGEMPLIYITTLDWEVARRLEYISLYLSVPTMALFSYNLFPADFPKKILYVILPVSAVFVLSSLFANYYTYTYLIRYFQLMILLVSGLALYVYPRAVFKKRPGSRLFLMGFLILLLCLINDILYVNLIIDSVPLFYVGLFFFIISLLALLSKQFSSNFSQLETANKKLSVMNNKLDSLNSEILSKNKELEKMNYELDLFVNRTSHDLKTPLTSLSGIVYVARQTEDTSTIKGVLARGEEILKRMSSLITDIIDFSKNKRVELVPARIDFNQIIRDAFEDSASLNGGKKINTNIEVDENKFVSDERCIRIILNNIISNAVKYSDASKEMPEIALQVSVLNNTAYIHLSDNGIGIEEHHIDKVFSIYYRATNTSSGSGLGLHLVKETVQKLNGSITLESQKNIGTKIEIVLPGLV